MSSCNVAFANRDEALPENFLSTSDRTPPFPRRLLPPPPLTQPRPTAEVVRVKRALDEQTQFVSTTSHIYSGVAVMRLTNNDRCILDCQRGHPSCSSSS
jgi:hypothetical protein